MLAVAGLIALWLLFFWRLFTPIAADQASLTLGDFSGQFVAFGGYQYDRLSSGEIPLWNPYNNGGFPFIADTQAAVFYPPRLLTVGLSSLAGSWSYHALELEMTAHVLLYTLLMYTLVRRMTGGARGSVFGAFIAAVIAGYGGFTAGYPLLQLAILEAGVWLPLAVLGVWEATKPNSIPSTPPPAPLPKFREGEQRSPQVNISPRIRGETEWGVNSTRSTWIRQGFITPTALWLLVTGIALGLSWLAGHPQTSYFLTLLVVVYLGYRVYAARLPGWVFVAGTALVGMVSFGLVAVQLIPGIEYLSRTARVDFSYDAKANGFPIQDVLQFVYPSVVSLFSPLFVGVTGLVLAVLAVWRRLSDARFWSVIALLALLWSFGGNGPLYPLLYNVLPGLRFFRGQERAAYLVMNSLAILAGLGAAHLARWDILRDYTATLRLRVWLRGLFIILLAFGGLVAVAWLGNPEAFGSVIGPVAQSTLVISALYLLLPAVWTRQDRPVLRWLVAGVLIVELFTVSLDADAIYDPIPPTEQISMTPPPLLEPIVTDEDTPFRVDGFRGLTDNYGSLYGIMDMRGISPLFLDSAFAIIEPEKINPLAWELFAVRYVFTDWQDLPVPSEIITTGEDRFGPVNLHRLSDPRPFAHLVYAYTTAPDDPAARTLLSDPAFPTRSTLILQGEPSLDLPATPPTDASAIVTVFAPEQFTIRVSTPTDALLSVSHPDYPGWSATIDEDPVEILRAYGGLAAVAVPAGDHTVEFVYNPLSYRVGAFISALTWIMLLVIGILWMGRNRDAIPE